MEPGYITIKSKSGNKEWFNICLYNNISSDVVNRSLITQSVDYKLDDNDWETFTTYYNSYLTRKVVYGYQVTFNNYEVEKDSNNFSEIPPINNSFFTVTSSDEYSAIGDIFMKGLKNIEIDEIDDMTAQELLAEVNSYISSLQRELNELKSNYVTYNTINLYATKDYVNSYIEEKLEGIDVSDLNLSDYVTYAYIDDVLSYINVDVDFTGYATESYVIEHIEGIVPISYNYTYEVSYIIEGGDTISLTDYVTYAYLSEQLEGFVPTTSYETLDLSDYVTYAYLVEQLSSIDAISYNISYEVSYNTGSDIDLSAYATKAYVASRIEETEENLNWRLNQYIAGPYAVLNVSYISYESQTVNDISTWFDVNSIFDNYKFSKPTLVSSYTESIWDSSPAPTGSNGTYTFKENIDIKELNYKITVSHNNPNYSYDFILTQGYSERLYFPQGNSLTLPDYHNRTVNLTQYIVTNVTEEPIYPTESFVSMSNLSSIYFFENDTTSSRSVTITVRDRHLNRYDFVITQPGNPNPGQGGGSLTPTEYTIDLSTFADGQISQDDILITAVKNTGSSNPVYNTSSGQLRIYANNTMTVSSEYTISKIEFGALQYNGGSISTEIPTLGEFDNDTQIWEGTATEVLFNVSNAGQYRITSLKITLLQ